MRRIRRRDRSSRCVTSADADERRINKPRRLRKRRGRKRRLRCNDSNHSDLLSSREAVVRRNVKREAWNVHLRQLLRLSVLQNRRSNSNLEANV